MNTLAAVDILETLTIDELQSLMPGEVVPASTNGGRNDRGLLVFFVAAGCSLSGQLPDCRTIDDLREAFTHFRALWDAGIVTDEQWSDEATAIFQEAQELFDHCNYLPTPAGIRTACDEIHRQREFPEDEQLPVQTRPHRLHELN